MELWRERNAATTIYFPLITRGSQDFETTITFVAADTQFSVDGGAFANTGSVPLHEGGGSYSLALLAAEVNGQNTVIKMVDAATKVFEDQAIVISTYGDASAEHAFNLNLATQPVNLTQLLGSAIATPTVTGVLEVDLTHVTGTLASITGGDLDVNVAAMSAGTITAAVIATDAVDADALAADAVTEIAAGVWDRDATLSQAQGSFGGTLGDQAADGDDVFALLNANLDATISSRMAETSINTTGGAVDTVTSVTNDVGITAASVDLIWDEPLTGATHNVVNSSGRRLRIIQEAGSYTLGIVFIDTVNGTAGTTDFENGVDILPCLTLADANTIAASRNLSKFDVSPGSSLTFVASQAGDQFEGQNWALDLGGQSISDGHFMGADITGVGIGATEAHFDHCEMGTCTLPVAHLDFCDIAATVTLSAASTYFFINCTHAGSSVIDFGAAVANTTVHVHGYTGALTISNLGQTGTDVLHFDSSGGQLTLDASCVGGTVNFRGTAELINNGSGITINRGGDVVNDVAGVQFDTDDIQTRLPAALVGGAMDSDVSAMQANVLTAAALASDAVDEIVDQVYEELLADHTTTDTFGEKFNNIPLGLQKNTATNDIAFLMVLTSDHVSPATGLTVTGQRSIDGGAFGAVTGTIAEIGGAVGMYQFDATAADMNGDIITFRFSSGTADDRFLTIITSPGP